MKILNLNNVEEFLKVIDQCEGKVELVSPEGDRLNLKSKLSQYVSLGKLLGSCNTEIPELEIIAYEPKDTQRLVNFLVNGNFK